MNWNTTAGEKVNINLTAVVVSLKDDSPAILRLAGSDDVVADILPSGAFDPTKYDTLDTGLRDLLKSQTGSKAGKIEQLYAGIDRHTGGNILAISYIALTTISGEKNTALGNSGARWKNWYAFLPWEDWRNGRPPVLDVILPALHNWANTEGANATTEQLDNSASRIDLAFGLGAHTWQEVRIVERIDLMIEAGLLVENNAANSKMIEPTGLAMAIGQRRILAVAIGRMRERVQNLPVVPDLMADEFTLTQLQKCAEGISGQLLHKQNFRRQIDNLGLVEKTGRSLQVTGGRPASLYRICETGA